MCNTEDNHTRSTHLDSDVLTHHNLAAECNRFRCGSGPISARSATDLGEKGRVTVRQDVLMSPASFGPDALRALVDTLRSRIETVVVGKPKAVNATIATFLAGGTSSSRTCPVSARPPSR